MSSEQIATNELMDLVKYHMDYDLFLSQRQKILSVLPQNVKELFERNNVNFSLPINLTSMKEINSILFIATYQMIGNTKNSQQQIGSYHGKKITIDCYQYPNSLPLLKRFQNRDKFVVDVDLVIELID